MRVCFINNNLPKLFKFYMKTINIESIPKSIEFQNFVNSSEGKKILVQGVGHVGETLVKYITEEGAQVIINDINEVRLEELSKKYHTNVILGNDIYNLDLDIYAPCALGATINDETIHQLNTKVIASELGGVHCELLVTFFFSL